jgi:magnesium transporter
VLTTFVCEGKALRRITEPPDQALRDAAWIDLLNPGTEEVNRVVGATDLRVPSEAELSEIETSSRLATDNGVLYLSMPLVSRLDAGPRSVPAGFVLSPERLLTIRFAPSRLFDEFSERQLSAETAERGGAHVLVGLLETIVDRQADALEQMRADLDAISQRIFREGQRLSRKGEDTMLRETLAAIGRTGEVISFIRDSQLGADRIVPYVLGNTKEWLPTELEPRLNTLRQDIASLKDYDLHLDDKVQFLLDATLGFISIAQNNVVKVLTVASVAGIPPVLIAGIYGMNFKLMPELDWHWGYPYALVVIALSTIVPLVWFKLKGWL